jgi:MinD-like ATPase involved in chromosome partitioning or flagellar assembly
MRVLIVEKTSNEQAATASRLESIDRLDKDILDLSLNLTDEANVFDRVKACDVVLVGASLGEQSAALVEQIKSAAPEVEILVILSRDCYRGGGFRAALSHGARKVLREDAPTLDLVQELMSIHEVFRAEGRVRQGRVIAVVQAKGGVGATSTCAALAEVCATHGRRALLWDLDIETRDLCRAAVVQGNQSVVVSEMITGERELSRDNLRQAVIPISQYTAVLPPPDNIAACLDFVGNVEAIDIAGAMVALTRHTYDTVIVDLGSRFSPAAGAIMQAADSVVVMVDDSILGLSAVRFFAPILQSVVRNPSSLFFLCSGISIPKEELARHVQEQGGGTACSWSLPVIPFDPAASKWPGSGKTLYSLGRRQTRKVFEELAYSLKIVDRASLDVCGERSKAEEIYSPMYALSLATLGLGVAYPLRLVWQRFIHS